MKMLFHIAVTFTLVGALIGSGATNAQENYADLSPEQAYVLLLEKFDSEAQLNREFRAETRLEIRQLREYTTTEISQLREETRNDISQLRDWIFGLVMAIVAGVFAILGGVFGIVYWAFKIVLADIIKPTDAASFGVAEKGAASYTTEQASHLRE